MHMLSMQCPKVCVNNSYPTNLLKSNGHRGKLCGSEREMQMQIEGLMKNLLIKLFYLEQFFSEHIQAEIKASYHSH